MFSIFNNSDLILAISEKKEGSMRLEGKDKEILKNRERFLKKLAIGKNKVINAGLVHKNKIKIVGKEDRGKIIKKTDGLITQDKNTFLAITVADCLPIFISEPSKKVIGLIHAGWRGLAEGILFSAVKKIRQKFKTEPQNILIGIGPSIGICHFEVKEDVLKKFERVPANLLKKEKNKVFFDLKRVAEIQLLGLGLKKENIEISSECTFCEKEKYFSHRREKKKTLKAMMVLFGQQ